jgi:hypothetical protein
MGSRSDLGGSAQIVVGKMQTAVSLSHRPEHVRRDSEAICSPMAGTDAMLNIQ